MEQEFLIPIVEKASQATPMEEVWGVQVLALGEMTQEDVEDFARGMTLNHRRPALHDPSRPTNQRICAMQVSSPIFTTRTHWRLEKGSGSGKYTLLPGPLLIADEKYM